MLQKDLLSQTIVVLDTETTGLYPDNGDEIIELAAEKIVNGQVFEKFHAFIKPTAVVSPEASAVHGLTEEFLLENGELGEIVFPRFHDFIIDCVLVGHNVRRFDHPFIAKHFNRHGLAVPANFIFDTLDVARSRLKLPNYKLGTVAAHFGITTDGAHRAGRDVEITRQVLLKFLES